MRSRNIVNISVYSFIKRRNKEFHRAAVRIIRLRELPLLRNRAPVSFPSNFPSRPRERAYALAYRVHGIIVRSRLPFYQRGNGARYRVRCECARAAASISDEP